MLKIRVRIVNDEKGNKELEEFEKDLGEKYTILYKSRLQKNRCGGAYADMYFNVEKEDSYE